MSDNYGSGTGKLHFQDIKAYTGQSENSTGNALDSLFDKCAFICDHYESIPDDDDEVSVFLRGNLTENDKIASKAAALIIPRTAPKQFLRYVEKCYARLSEFLTQAGVNESDYNISFGLWQQLTHPYETITPEQFDRMYKSNTTHNFYDACRLFLIAKARTMEGINTQNFINKCLPKTNNETLFLFSLWDHERNDPMGFMADLNASFASLAAQLDDYLNSVSSAVNRCLSSLEQAGTDRSSHNDAALVSLQNSYDDLLRKYRKQQSELDSLREKYNRLKAESEGETLPTDPVCSEENLSKPARESRLVFVCDRAENSRVQHTYDAILRHFSSSKLVYDITDCDLSDCDAVVILSKYMIHPTYFKMRDFCQASGVYYIQTSSQNPDRIEADIDNIWRL